MRDLFIMIGEKAAQDQVKIHIHYTISVDLLLWRRHTPLSIHWNQFPLPLVQLCHTHQTQDDFVLFVLLKLIFVVLKFWNSLLDIYRFLPNTWAGINSNTANTCYDKKRPLQCWGVSSPFTNRVSSVIKILPDGAHAWSLAVRICTVKAPYLREESRC